MVERGVRFRSTVLWVLAQALCCLGQSTVVSNDNSSAVKVADPWAVVGPHMMPSLVLDSTPDDVTVVFLTNTSVGLCKYKHFCSSLGCGPSYVVTSEMPPLCHCDRACLFYGDCCHDYEATCAVQAPPSSDLRNVNIKRDSLSCVTSHKFLLAANYLLVSVCPEDSDAQTAVSCEHPGVDDVLAAIPCYNQNSGMHFRNVHCALCHGEAIADLVPWDVTVDCDLTPWQYEHARELLKSSIRNLDRIEVELGCAVHIQAPDMLDLTKMARACYPDVKGHCTMQQDPLGDACASYMALTTVADHGDLGVFRNPHCALCNLPNGPDRVEHATDCSGDLPVFYLSGTLPNVFSDGTGFIGFNGEAGIDAGLGGPVRGLSPPISILFDFRASSDVKIVQKGEVLVSESVQCPPNAVYDPFTSRCRRLSCPRGYLLVEWQCVPDTNILGHGCGDDDIIVEMTVEFGDCLESRPNEEDDDVREVEEIKLCLEDFFRFELGTFQATTATPKPTIPCPGSVAYSFVANTTGGPFKNFQEIEELSLPAAPYCLALDTKAMWSVELNQHCRHLPKDKCTRHWLNGTQFSLPVQNGTTLVYVNASASWYVLNQTTLRANFLKREHFFEQSTHVQICVEPTLACPLVVLNSSLFHPHGNEPGSIVHSHTGRVFQSDEYFRTESGDIQVCSFFDNNGTQNGTAATFLAFSTPQQILSLIGNIISMAAAAITFVTYCAFKELRQRISLAIMSLVACLFLAQLLLLVSGSATSNPQACTAVAVLGHFFWLATVLWTGVLAFDLNQTFAYSSKIRRLESDKKIYLLHAVFSFGGAALVVLPCLVVHLCDCTDLPLWYGDDTVCWIGNGYVNLVAFGAPVAVVVAVNGVLFAFTVRGIRSTNKQSNPLKHTDKTELQRARQELMVYIKISSLMGFTWIIGFAAALGDVIALWYLFIVLNSCQGLLIFLSFICNQKVWRLWRAFLCARETDHKGSGSYSTRSGSSARPMLKRRSGSSSSNCTRKTTVTEL